MEEFMRDASAQLSKLNFSKVERITIQSLDEEASNRKLNSFIDLQKEIQLDLALIRRAKMDKQIAQPKTLSKAMVDSNPLEREEYLMKLQWDALSSIEFSESFTLTELMIYKLKLQILERLSSFNSEKGKAVFASIVNPQKS